WPPWNRTTPRAVSVSQSTSLPLPSSPHWVPTTTTLRPGITALLLFFIFLFPIKEISRSTHRSGPCLAPIRDRNGIHRLHDRGRARRTPRFHLAPASQQWLRANRYPCPRAHGWRPPAVAAKRPRPVLSNPG